MVFHYYFTGCSHFPKIYPSLGCCLNWPFLVYSIKKIERYFCAILRNYIFNTDAVNLSVRLWNIKCLLLKRTGRILFSFKYIGALMIYLIQCYLKSSLKWFFGILMTSSFLFNNDIVVLESCYFRLFIYVMEKKLSMECIAYRSEKSRWP